MRHGLGFTQQLLSIALITACFPVLAANDSNGEEYKYGISRPTKMMSHCVIEIELERAVGSRLEFKTSAQRCYETLSESIADVTDGNFLPPSNITGKELEAYGDEYQSWTLGEIYAGINFTSGSTVIKDAGGPCTAWEGFTISIPEMPPGGWNDVVSSARGSKKNGCLIKLWEHGHIQGYSTPFFRKWGTLGYMDNKTSSMQFTSR